MSWLRVATIGALFVGSVYVLLPTALQGDIEAQRAAAAAAVSTPTTSSAADLSVRLATPEPAAAAPVITARLTAAGLGFDRVSESGDGLVVSMRPGTDREDVIRIGTAPGVIRLYDPRDLAPAPSPLPPVPEAAPYDPDVFRALSVTGDARGHWASVANAWAMASVPAGASAMPTRVTRLDGELLVADGALPEGAPFAVVALDGEMVGLGLPSSAAGLTWTPLTRMVDSLQDKQFIADPDAASILAGGALPAVVEPVVAEQAQQVERREVAQVESTVPAWLLGILPDTAIALGLDLQGGLDITLQVELEDAVMAQVARDAASMRDQAKREKVTFAAVRKDKIEPIVWFEGADAGEIREFLRTRYSGYVLGPSDAEGRVGFVMTDTRIEEVQANAAEQVLETLRKRVDATGVKEPSIVKKSGGRINIQLPGAVDLQSAIDAIGTTAMLEFRMVDPKQDNAVLRDSLMKAKQTLPEDQWLDDRVVNDWLWATKRLDEDRIVLWHYEELPDGTMKRIDFSVDGREGPLLLMNEVPLTGNDVNDASVGFDQNNMPYVALNFKPRGAQVFCDLTTQHVRERFAIVLDNQIRSAPSIRERICGGRASIDMGSRVDAMQDAQTLALVLRTGSLDAPVSVGEVRQVGASLGRDSIIAGAEAAFAGGLVVLVFMALWYRKAGMIANVALMLNVLMVIASLALFGATLTLPGIAGIALTVGMAVDANIIIFERIREELALGIQPRKAVDTGFDKGLVAVVDANITTAIAGVVLFSYGTGPIKGFAVTLLIGIVTTLITALFVTRTLMGLVTRSSSARFSI